ncbi:hypothetical protein BO71DRAFT_135871 [Aspergillus ellipticus CBS 707.79]|uniref:Uncharacterized protein n=1 Tax=Aspergillus ellipticus CBS 707.79 TaxID=1448320 RepID=A0A319CTH8_9EURO|nr:hypothetical protein BO71DRAFT_135871 [Aspergillus ellipticus CBS 707.79]
MEPWNQHGSVRSASYGCAGVHMQQGQPPTEVLFSDKSRDTATADFPLFIALFGKSILQIAVGQRGRSSLAVSYSMKYQLPLYSKEG